jgi:hypothetical protein
MPCKLKSRSFCITFNAGSAYAEQSASNAFYGEINIKIIDYYKLFVCEKQLIIHGKEERNLSTRSAKDQRRISEGKREARILKES